ncbi:MAG TPA: hypothetical protein VN426_05675 [Syntrophomonadaceae bacterium]|nr:hypothetical protein [Syntrophomonadaceae bacterium]
MYSIYFYRIFETQMEIDLALLERELPRSHSLSRSRFSRVKTKSILMDSPPLLVNLGSVSMDAGQEDSFQAQARIYDIGSISICLIFNESLKEKTFIEDTAMAFAGQKGLTDTFTKLLNSLEEILKPALGSLEIDSNFYEDYTIYQIKEAGQIADPVALLMGEKAAFSEQIRAQVMGNRLSYSQDDFALVTWDTALICDPEDPGDLRDLIEFANVQLLELRYYDSLLSKQMENMYDDIEQAGSRPAYSRVGRYRRITSTSMRFIADITEVTEKIDNLIKITEDIYYARVYQATLGVLRTDQWRKSVNRKLQVIQQNYSLLSNEVNIQHSNILEWIIIILIALEFALAILQFLR